MPRPFAVIGFTVFFTLSILHQTETGVTVAAVAAFTVALIVTLLLKQIRKAKVLPVACLSGIIACALLICSNAFVYQPAVDYSGKTCDLTVRLLSNAQVNYGNYYYEGEIINIDGNEADFGIRLTFSTPPEAEAFDIISGKFNVYLPGSSNYDLLLSNKAKGLYIAAYPAEENYAVFNSEAESLAEELIYKIRTSIKEAIYRILPNEYGGLAVALILGDKSGISAETLSDFNAVGITHLVCVSGLHLSFWSMLFLGFFRRTGLNEKIAAVISALFVVIFMLVAGMTYSVMRAGIMMLIYLLSILLSRKHDSLNSLGFAITVIALENPFSMGSVGLQLSVLSSLGLILYFQFLQPEIYKKLEAFTCKPFVNSAKAALSAFAVTASAVCFTLPITLRLYKSFNFAVFISNFLAVTAASVCMVLCGLGAVLNILIPDFFNLPAFLGGLLCKYLTFISDFIARWDFFTFRIESDKALLLICGIILLCALAVLFAFYGKKIKITTVLVCAFVFVSGLFTFSISAKHETVFKVIDCGNGTAVLFSNKNTDILIGCGGTLFSAENKIIDAVDFAGGVDYIIVPSEKESDSAFLVSLLKSSKPEGVISDKLPSGAELLLNGVDVYSFSQMSICDEIDIKSVFVGDSQYVLVKNEDIKALICFDYIENLTRLPDEFRDVDVIISRSDYPKDVALASPDVVVINAENSRGVMIQNELISKGITAAATAECGNIIIRADNGNVMLYRE